MKWNYTCNRYFSKPLWGIIGICNFLLGMSWLFAHYRNGKFSEPLTIGDVTYPPQLTFKNWSYWECVKHEWKGRHND